MPILKHRHQQRLDVILVTEEGPSAVVAGTGRWRDGRLFLHQGADVPDFAIPAEMVGQVQSVAPELRTILGCPELSVVLAQAVKVCHEEAPEPHTLAFG